MQINLNLPSTDAERLAQQSMAAGYVDIREYILDQLHSIAQQNTDNNELSEDELRESASLCEQAMDDIREGKCTPFDEAMQSIADRLGLKLKR